MHKKSKRRHEQRQNFHRVGKERTRKSSKFLGKIKQKKTTKVAERRMKIKPLPARFASRKVDDLGSRELDGSRSGNAGNQNVKERKKIPRGTRGRRQKQKGKKRTKRAAATTSGKKKKKKLSAGGNSPVWEVVPGQKNTTRIWGQKKGTTD